MLTSLFHPRAGQPPTLHRPLPPIVVRCVGVSILIGAIAILSWNERRMTLPFFAHRAQPIEANSPERIDTIEYVAATGLITAATDVGDEPYLPPGPFIAVNRTVEMYAWEEQFPDDSGLAAYERVWTETPQDSSRFQQPSGHENPPKPLASKLHRVLAAKLGIFDVDMQQLSFPPFRPLELQPNSTNVAGVTLQDGMLFRGTGTATRPNTGDIRIRYGVIPQAQTMTLFAGVNGRKLLPYRHPNGFESYHVLHGTLSDALARLDRQRDTLLWPLRFIGGILVWLAIAFLSPITPIAQRWEFLGQLHRPLRPLLLVPAAFVVTAILIVLLDYLFSMWVGIAAAGALVLSLMLVERWIIRTIPILAVPVDPRAPVAAASLAQLPPALISFNAQSASTVQPPAPIPAPAQPLPVPAAPPVSLAAAPLSNLPAAPLPSAPVQTDAPVKGDTKVKKVKKVKKVLNVSKKTMKKTKTKAKAKPSKKSRR